ncbi:MAG: hypothetical protein ABS81_11495 [Pseudonocardia sp. SCN 72-86]|nr:MAG: hypothetical protein ABS81_11495 [Pseudonocardia sp. SCN 72-86]
MSFGFASRVAMTAAGLGGWALAHVLTETLFAHGHASRRVDHIVGPVLLTGTAVLATSFAALALLAFYGPDPRHTTRRASWGHSARWGAMAPTAFITIDLVEHLLLGQPALSAAVAVSGVLIHATLGTAVAGAVQACTRALRVALRIPGAFVARPHAGVSRAAAFLHSALRRGFVSVQHGRGPPTTGRAPVLVPALVPTTA